MGRRALRWRWKACGKAWLRGGEQRVRTSDGGWRAGRASRRTFYSHHTTCQRKAAPTNHQTLYILLTCHRTHP
jgi:hypothetical protein